MNVRDDERDATQIASCIHGKGQNSTNSVEIDAIGDYHGGRNLAPGLPHFYIRRVNSEVRPIAFIRSIQKRVDTLTATSTFPAIRRGSRKPGG